MVAPALLLALNPDGPMGHDRLESAMFWVGAMFAFMPILVGLAVFGVLWWHRKKAGVPGATSADEGPPPGERAAP